MTYRKIHFVSFLFRPMDIENAPALVARVSFTGELGYEIWMKSDYQLAVYDALCAAGGEFDMRHFGGRAPEFITTGKEFWQFYPGIHAGLHAV